MKNKFNLIFIFILISLVTYNVSYAAPTTVFGVVSETGSNTLTGDQTIVGDLTVDNIITDSILAGAGVSGVLTLGGTGGTNNENITFNFESFSNRINVGSSTGVDVVDYNALSTTLDDDYGRRWGNSDDIYMIWKTTGNDNFQIGTVVGSATGSGYVSIMEKADIGNANRSPLSTSDNPVLRIYSSDETSATDYIEMYHNQTQAYIGAGGVLALAPTSDIIFTPGSGYLNFQASDGKYRYTDEGTSQLDIRMNRDFGQVVYGLADGAGNQLVIGNFFNVNLDYDHAAQTNPTFYIHSDTNPDTANDEWISFTHDVTNGVIDVGSGALTFLNAGTEMARFDASTTAGDTRFMLYDVDNATVERVTVAAADSCSAGYKCLRIPN